jgi:hypothetical protein
MWVRGFPCAVRKVNGDAERNSLQDVCVRQALKLPFFLCLLVHYSAVLFAAFRARPCRI